MSKPRKIKTTVNPDAVKREVSKIAKGMSQEQAPGELGSVIDPGTVRRESPLEQNMGTGKYHDMIHAHNDKHKHILDKLPFTFPKKSIVRSHRNILIECVECGFQKYGTEHTYGITCPQCQTFRRVHNPESEARGASAPEEDDNVGIFGTASDLLNRRKQRMESQEKTKKNKK